MLAPIQFRTAVFALAATVALSGHALDSHAQQAPTVPTLNYNKDTFYVPFSADALSPEVVATEVLLFVSGDRGASWQLYQRQVPAAKRFAFRAAVDGEYWFAVRTLMTDEAEPSTDGLQPGLRVVLDTKKPELDLSAALLSATEAGIVWGIKDKNLDPNSLRMEYRTSSAGVWQPILPSGVKPIERGYRGESTWQLSQPVESMEIRATVKDDAGNETRIADTIRPMRHASQSLASQSLASQSLAGQAGQPRSNEAILQSGTLANGGTGNVGAQAGRGGVFLNPQRAAQPAVAHRSDQKGWQTVAKQQTPIRVDNVPTAPMIENHTLKAPHEVLSPKMTNGLLTRASPALAQPPVASNTVASHAASSHAAVSNATVSNATVSNTAVPNTAVPNTLATRQPIAANTPVPRPPAATSLPAPTQAHMSASRQFHLDYDVEATDVNSVARVSLWATVDNGHTWTMYGEDPDKISPFLVDVQDDGIYGFRMLIENSDGIAPRPPQSGDSADVWIHVDSTKPTARIVSARFGRNANLGQLQIYWDAADQNLTGQPVTLLYSDQPNGPWRVIAEQVANTSRFDWNVKESVPSDFYLQLEVRDTAGNVTRDTLRDPISRDGLAPRGVIKDVRPASDAINAPSSINAPSPTNPTLGGAQLPSAMQAPIAPPTGPPSTGPPPTGPPSTGPSLEPARVPATLDYPQSSVRESGEVMEAKLPSTMR